MADKFYQIESGNRLYSGYPTQHTPYKTFQEAAESFEVLDKRLGEHFRLRIVRIERSVLRTNG